MAAGESSRMGTDKALLAWPPQAPGQIPSKGTFLSAAIHSLALATDFILVVVGRNALTVAPIAYANGASLAINPDPSRGQFSSLQVALQEVLNRGRDAAVITLVDRPPVSPATVQLLRDAFESAPQSIWSVVPEFSGKRGCPYLVGRELIELFLRASPTANESDIEQRCHEHIQYVGVSDPFLAANINTPADYAALLMPSS